MVVPADVVVGGRRQRIDRGERGRVEFGFQMAEEVLDHGVVQTVPSAGHRWDRPSLSKQLLPGSMLMLEALIGKHEGMVTETERGEGRAQGGGGQGQRGDRPSV